MLTSVIFFCISHSHS